MSTPAESSAWGGPTLAQVWEARRKEALELHQAGKSFQEIKDALGLKTKEQARALVAKAARYTRQAAERAERTRAQLAKIKSLPLPILKRGLAPSGPPRKRTPKIPAANLGNGKHFWQKGEKGWHQCAFCAEQTQFPRALLTAPCLKNPRPQSPPAEPAAGPPAACP